jgi:hypothetical protein
MEHLDKLAREPHTAVMSCELDLGVTDVVDKSWEMLNLIRIYTKRFVSSTHSFSVTLLAHTKYLTGKEWILTSLKLSSFVMAPPSKMSAIRFIAL